MREDMHLPYSMYGSSELQPSPPPAAPGLPTTPLTTLTLSSCLVPMSPGQSRTQDP